MTWKPNLGAWMEKEETHFRVWAPGCRQVWVCLAGPDNLSDRLPLLASDQGYHSGTFRYWRPGDTYRFQLEEQGCFPDPASRYQPLGVHGPSQIVRLDDFPWNDSDWWGPDPGQLLFYELHVGTFTPEGTFPAAEERLPYLQKLGITAIEIMPVADFPGKRNWGYDGVALFAPARCYGAPRDLQQLVDRAHQLEMSVFLDVVYNHLGPDGNYLGTYSPDYFSSRHKSPWGAAVNFDGKNAGHVRRFFLENALYWIHEFHLDGLRLDATHALKDNSKRHFLQQLSMEIRESLPPGSRRVLLIAEDNRNLARLCRPVQKGGFGLDGIWVDDFHHQAHRFFTNERDGYYRSYRGTTGALAHTIRQGWTRAGAHARSSRNSGRRNARRLEKNQYIFCLQNHDQVGNRALGERLHHLVDPAEYRAAAALLLLSPETPLLFMGQEWGASSPFLYFTDHQGRLGEQVTQGRRLEFKKFQSFADPHQREFIPDPQATQTFQRSQLPWEELNQCSGLRTLHLYQDLIRLRKEIYGWEGAVRRQVEVASLGRSVIRFFWPQHDRLPPVLAMVRLRGKGESPFHVSGMPGIESRAGFLLRFSTESGIYADSPQAPSIHDDRKSIYFYRPGAVVLQFQLQEVVP